MPPKRKADNQKPLESYNEVYENLKIQDNEDNEINKKLNEEFNERYKDKSKSIKMYPGAKKGELYIDIVITDLPVYKNLEYKFNDKIELNNINKGDLPNKIFAKYVFMRLLRLLFYIDYLHDFTNSGRNNVLIKESERPIDKRTRIQNLKSFYNEQYNSDILDMKQHIFKIDNIINNESLDNNILLNFNDRIISLKELNDKIIENSSQKLLEEGVMYILKFLDISLITSPDEISNYSCYNSLNKILLIGEQQEVDLNIVVDTDKSRFDLYPIVMKMCDLTFTKKTDYESINILASILDLYDGASTSALEGIINKLKILYPNIENLTKIGVKKSKYLSINVVVKLDLDDSYKNRYMDFSFTREGRDDNTRCGLNINRFYALDDPILNSKKRIYNGSLSNISSKMNEYYNDNNIKLNEKKSLITYYSYYKTLGDFSQILFCYQESIINSKSKYIFLSFDKIASYISSLFNYGTLRENYENPFMPLSYFAYNWNKSSKDYEIVNKPRFQLPNNYKVVNKEWLPSIYKRVGDNEEENKFEYSPTYRIVENDGKRTKLSFGKYTRTYGIPKRELSKDRIESLIKLSKKYNIKLDNNTYKNLKILYKLQLLAKKLRIPITYKKKDKRNYKSIKMLENDIKRKY